MRRRGAEDHRIVFTYGDTNIRHSDIATLAPRAWLGDNLLAYHCEVLNKHTKQLFWPPTIVELLCAFSNKETLTSLLPLQDLKDTTDNLWLIVNDKYASDAPDADGSHWACARYDVRQRRLYAFDSLADARSENAPAAFFKKLVRQLTILFDGPVKLVPVRFESQENSFDCGVYVLAIMTLLAESRGSASQMGRQLECCTADRITALRHMYFALLTATDRFETEEERATAIMDDIGTLLSSDSESEDSDDTYTPTRLHRR